MSERTAVEWSAATRSRAGEVTSGDLAVVSVRAGGALVAAIDGVGHGRAAALAAATAAETMRDESERDPVALIRRSHAALAGTRGAAITIAFVSSAADSITWLGVGNVEARVLSGDPVVNAPKASLALGPGVVGHELPRLRTTTVDIRLGDLLILATDGISANFADALDTSRSTEAIGDRVMARHRKRADDALVVTVRYLGGRP